MFAIIYLIIAYSSIGTISFNRPMADFGPMDPAEPNGFYGKQDCIKYGAKSVLIIEAVLAFLGAGIYVRNNQWVFLVFIGVPGSSYLEMLIQGFGAYACHVKRTAWVSNFFYLHGKCAFVHSSSS